MKINARNKAVNTIPGAKTNEEIKLGRWGGRSVRNQVFDGRLEHAVQFRALYGESAGRIGALSCKLHGHKRHVTNE